MRNFFKNLKTYRQLLLMLMPAVSFFFVFNYLPMLGIIITFKRYDFALGVFKSPWIGLDNFKYLIANKDIFGVIRNTVMYNALFIIVNNSVAIMVSIMLAELKSKYFKKLSQSIIYLLKTVLF